MDSRILRKNISIGSIALTGILFIVAGILMLLWIGGIPSMVKVMVLVYCLVLSFFEVLAWLSKRKWHYLLRALTPVFLGITLMVSPSSLSTLFSFLMGSYISLLGFFRLIDFIVLNANKTPGRWMALTGTIITFLFSLPMFFSPSIYVNRAIIITSIFCVFHGLSYIGDFLIQIAPNKKVAPYKRKIRINMPILFTSFLPKKSIQQLNKLLAVDADGILIEESFKGEEKSDLEILIHATETGFSSMGHVDLVFEDKVYSYGNYDPESWKFFQSVGDGVLLVVSGRDKYIDFRLSDVGNSLFAFGIKLTEEQRKSVSKALEDFKEHTLLWSTRQQRKNDSILIDQEPADYASRLSRELSIKAYKFKDTSFKGYFVMTTNCVKLADQIIRSAGIAAATPNGILTPGGYYDFFNRQYGMKKSIVVSKQSYHPKGEIQHEGSTIS